MEKYNTIFKRIFIGLSVLLLVLMPILSKDYGQTGDEDVEILYGIDIYNYYFNGDKQALDYSNAGAHREGQQNYGGMFNIVTELTQKAFPSFHIIEVRHFYGGIVGALLMIFTGLFVYHILGKRWLWGLVALLFMVFSPRIFGESMNNGKDIPFALGFIMAMFFAARAIDNYQHKARLLDGLGVAVGLAIAIGCRSANAVLLILYIGVYLLLKLFLDKDFRKWIIDFKNKPTQKFYVFCILSVVVGYFGGLLFWPYGLEGPISNVLASVEEMKNRATPIKMLYDGQMISSHNAPKGYLPTWIIISTPVIIVASYFLFYASLPFNKNAKSLWLFLIFGSTFPILYIIYKESNIYDSWRHMFFVYPFIVAAAVMAIQVLVQKIANVKIQYAVLAIVLIGLLPSIIWTIKEHPNQYLYFNEVFGGPSNAFGKYELDYYGHTGKASADWILKEEKGKAHPQKLIVRGNLEGLEYYFKDDTTWVDFNKEYVRWYERGNKDWDYYISYTRFVPEWQLQKGKWPPASVTHAVKVGDTPVGIVIKRKSKNDYLAFEALEKKNFDEAVRLYEAHLKIDSSDEYVMLNYAFALLNSADPQKNDKARAALENALTLNNKLKNAYDMLSYIYYSENNMDKANYYKNKANAL